MLNLIAGILAIAFELAAWNGDQFIHAFSDADLAWHLALHALSSLLLAYAVLIILPRQLAEPRGAVLLLLALTSYAIPVFGFFSVVVCALYLRFYRKKEVAQDFGSIELPVFDPHQRLGSGFRQSGLRSFLGNSEVPMQARIGAMIALQHVSARVSTPLLRDVLSDPSEDIRLLAYGMLDNQEKKINQAIDAELKILNAPEGQAAEAQLLAAQRLSDLYWELIYQELVQGDLRNYAIGESARYAEMVLQKEPGNAALNLRLGRLYHANGQSEKAEQSYLRASELGLPATRILPYLAELRFEQKDFLGAQSFMRQLANWGSLPRLRPIIDYWNQQ